VGIPFDPKKNLLNLRRHGVSLTEGDGVLNDPLALTIEDDAAEGEQRFISIGMNTFGRLMVIVYTQGRRLPPHFRAARRTKREASL
jgi:uncharacterized DUF497 family protein